MTVADPDGTRVNTRDNTPDVVHVELVQGDSVEGIVAAKGGGSERGPAAIDSIKRHGAGYCIAVGGAACLVSKAIKASRVRRNPGRHCVNAGPGRSAAWNAR